MADCGWDVTCLTTNALSSAFDEIARDAAGAAGKIIGNLFTWWVGKESVNPDTEVVHNLQQYTIPIALLVLTGSILVQAIRMILSRKKDPVLNIGLGLIRYAVVTTIGLALLAAIIRAGDEWSEWLVDHAVRDFAERMRTVMDGELISNTFLLLIMALFALVTGAVQWCILVFVQAGILVLSVMLPLAASGSINDSTKPWLNRLIPWLLSLALYKPVAAMIYAIAFTLFAKGEDLITMIYGLMAMVCAAIAMPAMMKFFAWSQLTTTSGPSAGGALAAGATGAASIAALRGARGMELTGPGSAPTGAAGSGSTSSSAPTGAASSGSTSSSAPTGAASSGSTSSGGGQGGQTVFDGSKGWTRASGGVGTAGSTGGTQPPGDRPEGATGAPGAGVVSTRAGGGVPPGSAGPAAGGVAAAGGAAAAGVAVARGAYQAGQTAADGMTQGGGQQQ